VGHIFDICGPLFFGSWVSIAGRCVHSCRADIIVICDTAGFKVSRLRVNVKVSRVWGQGQG